MEQHHQVESTANELIILWLGGQELCLLPSSVRLQSESKKNSPSFYLHPRLHLSYSLVRVSCITPECQSCLYSNAASPCRARRWWWLPGWLLTEAKTRWLSGLIRHSLLELKVGGGSVSFTWADFGAEPPLDAFLMNILQAAQAATWLDQGVGGRFLAHLADAAHVAFFLVRILQQQSAERKKTVVCFYLLS